MVKVSIFKPRTEMINWDNEKGLPLDNYIISDKIKEKLNGLFEYECVIRITENTEQILLDYIKEGALITVKDETNLFYFTAFETAREIFRIKNIRKTRNEIEIYALHMVQNDIMNWFLEDSRPTNMTANQFLNKIQYESKYKTGNYISLKSEDNSTINTSYFINKNVFEAIYDAENSLLNRWGGEIIIYMNMLIHKQRRGKDTSYVIESNKNLTGFEMKINTDNLVTVIYAQGFDGIKAKGPIISDLANNYPLYYPKVIKYEDVKVKGDNSDEGYDTLEEAQEELERLAKLEFTEKGIDKIKATYSVDFVELKNTEEYKNTYEGIADLGLGDTVTIREDVYNTNLKVRIIEREYSPIAGKRIKTVLSNEIIENTMSNNASGIIAELESLKKYGSGGLGAYIDEKIKEGLKNSYAIAKQDEFLVADDRDLNNAQNVVRLNRNGLGFSDTGYNGTYKYGFTIDGKINADLISTGTLDANLVRTGIISSKNGDTIFNLENGEISSSFEDGSKIIISPKNGFYNMFGTNKREYHHIIQTSTINVGGFGDGNDTICKIQLPDEFKGKTFKPQCFLQGWFIKSGANIQTLTTGIVWETVSYKNATFEIFCKAIDSEGNFFSNINIVYMAIA